MPGHSFQEATQATALARRRRRRLGKPLASPWPAPDKANGPLGVTGQARARKAAVLGGEASQRKGHASGRDK